MEPVSKGLVFIPDISGFTRFVEQVDLETGRQVISALLSALLESNQLGLQVSEIEGDAVLFYKFGIPPSLPETLAQFEVMRQAFADKLGEMHDLLPEGTELSLKLIVHYGPLATYSLGGFTKLYGLAVVEAHRLLKNKINSHTYVLVTDAYLDACQPDPWEILLEWIRTDKRCELYQYLGSICFIYFPFDSLAPKTPLPMN